MSLLPGKRLDVVKVLHDSACIFQIFVLQIYGLATDVVINTVTENERLGGELLTEFRGWVKRNLLPSRISCRGWAPSLLSPVYRQLRIGFVAPLLHWPLLLS